MPITREQLVSEHVSKELFDLDVIWNRAHETKRGCWELELPHRYTNPQVNIGKRTYLVHRLVANVPKGMVAIRTCNNSWCFRPSHVRAITHKEKFRMQMEKA